ncbi:nitronate monooxygenase [Actinomadura parmotrematis]|uniref:Propionate 3-nitronate monooxygenase n=1 Tax=Actinomadura parmotrematis TaxID=2864039 RepID=A0ABS7FRP7_9ACTN|nr:nitronate monooxygenase [Actinomadura parmotrematis]MBW8483080.1 nitronate monooxygenase [Actinomadura parmotrematis]
MTGWWPEVPIVQAPMAGGPGGPALAAAVAGAGGLGFLAGGNKTAAALRAEIDDLRSRTAGPFGVNLFLPSADAPDGAALARYRDLLAADAARLGAEPGGPGPRDDGYGAKVADLLRDPPPVVSFTFGNPAPDVVRAFQERGTGVVVTVTSADEAREAGGADALCVQGAEAGGHQGSFRNHDGPRLPVRDLLRAVRDVTDRPLIAAGGIADAGAVAELLGLGAAAVQIGTALLRSPESGATAVHKAALADPAFTATALTRAFSGRPARGLVNRFLTEHDADAPALYPDVHYLTAPLRRAAANRGDAGGVNLWAGEGWRAARDAPAAQIVADLARGAR